MNRLLMNREIYEDLILNYVPKANRYLWIITADIKDMHVDTGKSFESFLNVLSQLVERGVAVRLIHAKEPGPRFRQTFDEHDTLINSELFERILCPRVHTKAIVIDGKIAFVGSANLTGAGMGGKNADRRNFEAGVLFDDVNQIQKLSDWVDGLYLGNYCKSCQRREYCPDPIIDNL